ncbi:polysaccharide deacetylase family protein [Paraburkholderia bengalensis]|uniref:Polysaccharide deacetylase family protein n=1 Tax=Paraburkholderia bengalensis TaxID=2747562 RepID=A0ABU8J5E4_9BURK
MSIAILTYHQIAEVPPHGTPLRALTVSPADFRRQMAWMHRLGFRGLSMRDLMPYLRRERTGKVFGITFDDGFRNVHQHAMPVLDAFGFTATNYFVSHQLNGTNVWDRELGVPDAPLMGVPEMREWARAGHEVGSHTLDHVHLPKVRPEEALRQIVQSKHELEQLLGDPVTAFCYPYGEQEPAHREMVKDAGYVSATLTQRGRASVSDDPFSLPRITVSSRSILRFLQKSLTRHEDIRRNSPREIRRKTDSSSLV